MLGLIVQTTTPAHSSPQPSGHSFWFQCKGTTQFILGFEISYYLHLAILILILTFYVIFL
jgi:hypothetical protein